MQGDPTIMDPLAPQTPPGVNLDHQTFPRVPCPSDQSVTVQLNHGHEVKALYLAICFPQVRKVVYDSTTAMKVPIALFVSHHPLPIR